MRNKIIISLLSVVAAISSCRYGEIGDADYVPQKIYMPSAVNGIYLVNDTNVQSNPYRYVLDLSANRLIIPLGVYRSGVNNKGNVNVNVLVDNDTIRQLIHDKTYVSEDGQNLELLPAENYTLSPSVIIPDGENNAKMELSIDLDYIATQPEKRLALAVKVSAQGVENHSTMSTSILEINTRFIVPTAKFKMVFDKNNDKKVIFTNLSSYAKTCTWDFGDGQTRTTLKDTIHHYFTGYESYNVKLTVNGITNKPVISSLPVRIWENITADYIKNPGNPFLRSDSRTAVVGNLADWTATDNIKALSSGVLYGGYYKSYTISSAIYQGVMDMYSKKVYTNGKIYQTISLLPGSYRLSFTPLDFKGKNKCYFAAATGDVMPDFEQMEGNNVLAKTYFDSMPDGTQEIVFTLSSPQSVTFGFVVNTEAVASPAYNELVILSVGLYK